MIKGKKKKEKRLGFWAKLLALDHPLSTFYYTYTCPTCFRDTSPKRNAPPCPMTEISRILQATRPWPTPFPQTVLSGDKNNRRPSIPEKLRSWQPHFPTNHTIIIITKKLKKCIEKI